MSRTPQSFPSFAPPPRPLVTLIGGEADGRRIPAPFGSYATVESAPGVREAYMQHRVFLQSGEPIEVWALKGMAPAVAVRALLDAYPGAPRPVEIDPANGPAS